MRVHFVNGSIFDGHHYRGAGELWVEDGVIVAAPGGPADERIDLDGGLLAPGFIDAHAHPVQGGLERVRCDLSAGSTREDYREAVKSYADSHPDAEWILGGGWAMSAFPGGTPRREDLDDLVPDRPVYLPNRDHHGAWVNSRALELAGVDATTADPADGRFERDADGTPTGTLHEGAMAAVARLIPVETDDELYAGLLEGQRYLHSVGVTGWQDAIIGKYAGHGDPAKAYVRAVREGTLTAEVVGALWWSRHEGVEQVAGLIEQRQALTCARFRATSVKIMQDGVAENFTAAMTAPYLDRCGHPTDNSGHSFLEAQALREAVSALTRADFQVHIHAIGDRGVREALDAFEAADRPDLLPHIAHLQVVDPTDVPRFAALGVTANMQMLWACLEDQMVELTMPFLGPERSTWQYPFGGLHRSGAHLCAGSDWPVSTPDPLQAIHTAVTRMSYDEPGRAGAEPLLPEQALSLEVAFAAYTSGSARINTSRAGTTAPGRPADLVVLDRDPFTGPVQDIGATRVVSTWINGQPV